MRIYLKAAGAEGAEGGEGKEPELVVVGDGAEAGAAEGADDRTGDRDGEDRGGERGEGDEDTRLGRSEDDGEGEEGRGHRRESRAEKNERRRRARDRDRTELRYLRTRNEQLERKESETAQRLDRLESRGDEEKLGRIKSAIRNAESTIVKLTAAGEEGQALEATQIKNNLQDQLDREQRRMEDARDKREQPAREERQEQRGGGEDGGLSQTARKNALAWQARNNWFRPDDPGTDERVVHALDAAILAEGEFAPEDPEYYRELDRRIAEYMPHRQKRANGGDRDGDDTRGDRRDERDEREERRGEGRRDNDDRTEDRGGREERREERPRKDAPRFRVGGRERALKPNEVYLSKERREALEMMGADNDPVLMKRYLKSFKDYDEQAARRTK